MELAENQPLYYDEAQNLDIQKIYKSVWFRIKYFTKFVFIKFRM